MKAIIADDELHLAQYLRDKLAKLWPELQIVAIADSGPAAAAAIAEHAPDIAFLDIRMPGATGLQVAEKLTGHIKVVFVTAYDQYALDAFERDAVDYLLKPVTDERLTRTIEKLKASAPVAGPRAAAAAALAASGGRRCDPSLALDSCQQAHGRRRTHAANPGRRRAVFPGRR